MEGPVVAVWCSVPAEPEPVKLTEMDRCLLPMTRSGVPGALFALAESSTQIYAEKEIGERNKVIDTLAGATRTARRNIQ